MKLLERLKQIMHNNIQTDETNQNEDRNKIKMNESYENNLVELVQEAKNSESVNHKEINSDSFQDIEVEYEIVEKEILPEKIICPDCGGITLEGLDFCDKCGGELYIYNR